MLKRIFASLLCGIMLACLLTPLCAIAADTPETLLNSAKLTPMKTNYQPLDDLVQQTFAKIFKPGMSTYEKTKACFDYLSHDSTYATNDITEELYNTIGKTVQYESRLDSVVVCEAFGMLTNKIGTCNHFASGFLVMTRAIGLESFIQTCVANGEIAGTKDHYFVVMRLQGKLYAFDARMGLLRNNAGADGLECFCTDMGTITETPCDSDECLPEFGGFRTVSSKQYFRAPEIQGKTEGDRHFNFGSYPQSRVEDKTLTDALDKLAASAAFTSFRYSSGKGSIGTQARWDYMWYTDVSYKGERYRGIKFSYFRPFYAYYSPERDFSYQDNNGYDQKNTVYWFKFEPIEWRLLDGNNLLITDFAIDVQSYQNAEYYDKTGKTFNGIVCHYFGDSAHTYPANDWEHSYLRKWLNEDFYNTAFTAEEKKMIAAAAIDNSGYAGRYSSGETVDNVWLLSYYEVTKSDYIFSTDPTSRDTQATDYALAQGVCTWENDSRVKLVPWRLRSAGFHSDDTCYVTPQGLAHYHLDTLGAMTGIRPVIRISDTGKLSSMGPQTINRLAAAATGTKEITLRCSSVNSAKTYRFYQYATDGKTLEKTYDADGPSLKITGLTAGKTYVFRASALTVTGGKQTETAKSVPASVMCRFFVETPSRPTATSPATGTIALTWGTVAGADHYNVYQYVDKETLKLVAQPKAGEVSLTNLTCGFTYYYAVSAVSPDGFESFTSREASALCVSYPAKPANLTGRATATGEITLSWTASGDAQAYQIYQYKSQNTAEKVGTTNGTTFTVKNLSCGSSYYFYVVATADDGKSVSASSDVITVTCASIPAAPENVTGKAFAPGEIILRWKRSKGAQYYKVYRYTGQDTAELVGTTAANGFIVSNLHVGTTYYFYVVAVGGNGKNTSASSKVVSVLCENVRQTEKRIKKTVIRGDMDGDWRVSSADARLSLRLSVLLENFAINSAEYLAGDADGDGRVTSGDARLILRTSVGLDDVIEAVEVP